MVPKAPSIVKFWIFCYFFFFRIGPLILSFVTSLCLACLFWLLSTFETYTFILWFLSCSKYIWQTWSYLMTFFHNILVWLPAKAFLRDKCVSTHLNRFISDPSFRKSILRGMILVISRRMILVLSKYIQLPL